MVFWQPIFSLKRIINIIGDNMKKILIVGFLVLGFSSLSLTQEKPSHPLKTNINSSEYIKEVENKIPQLMEKGLIPGISLTIIRDGKIFLTKSFGVQDTKTKEPVTKNTIFQAASLSKPVFTYAVLKLIEKGLINLDKPLFEYVTASYIQEIFSETICKNNQFKEITTRMILSHSCGFPNWRQGNLEIRFKPGSKFSYSGEGFVLLQRVVEKITNKQLNDLMKETVFKPLGMSNSSYTWENKFDKNGASAHKYLIPSGVRKGSEANSATSLMTNSADYAKFILAIMNHKGLQKKTFTLMLTPQIEVEKPGIISWGLGVGLQKTDQGMAYWHWGDNGTYKAFFLAFPQEKIGLVYFANCYLGLSIAPDLTKLCLGGKHPVFESSIMDDYARYDSPLVKLIHTYLNKGIDQVINFIKEKKASADFKEILSLKGLQRIGLELQSSNDAKAALKIFLLNLEYNPHSFDTHKDLARAYLENKDLKQPILYYQKALDLAKGKEIDTKAITWGMTFIKGLKNPPQLSLDHLKRLAGDYGPRHIVLKEGDLYYFRDNADTKEYKKLIPISKDTFIMEHLINFRLRFNIPKTGAAKKVTGISEWGTEDVSVRTK